MQHFIITGGLAAGKTKLVNNIAAGGGWTIGSPATTMKRSLARCIARTINHESDGDLGWDFFFHDMMEGSKEKYRGILQGYGEHFSNMDNFFWINKVMLEVQASLQTDRWKEGFDWANGTLYDSIRRPSEIIGIRNIFQQAIHIRLNISHKRQMDYLTAMKGLTASAAEDILAHSSEHWLDDIKGTDYAADVEIDADKGDAYIWQEYVKRALTASRFND